MLTNRMGKVLVDFYYRTSPPIAEFITKHPNLKPIVRTILVPAVALSTIAINTTLPQKATIAALLVLVFVGLIISAAKRRDRGQHYTLERNRRKTCFL